MDTIAAAGLGVALIILLLIIRWKWRSSQKRLREQYFMAAKRRQSHPRFVFVPPMHYAQAEVEAPPTPQLVHKLCPHNNVLQGFEVDQKDSLDDHLNLLTKKLAEKEGRLRVSRSKIRETQNEIENLHAIDQDVRTRYREIMESLRGDLMTNEKECKKLQEQIEWVSRRRAELKEEVRRGHRLYGEAAAELASNLAELHRGRLADHRVTAKPLDQSSTTLRHRKEPQLPQAAAVGSIVIKSPPTVTPDQKGSYIDH